MSDSHPQRLQLQPDNPQRLANLCGRHNEHLRLIENRLGLSISNRGNVFELEGSTEARDSGARLLQALYEETATQPVLTPDLVHLALTEVQPRAAADLQPAPAESSIPEELLLLRTPKVSVRPRTQKVDPYLRPLYDALYEMLGFERVAKLIERNVIEIAPLAFMRGRTLNNSFIILDESQNTTTMQMKMFLTRIGFGSTAVITGDHTQIDLPKGTRSGLVQATQILPKVSGVSFTWFNSGDVVRHPIVQRIVDAYDEYDRQTVAALGPADKDRQHERDH
jgi:phosphate starvation-inducible PhoH-like protein